MALNPNSFVRLFIVIFLLTMGYISYKVYEEVIFVEKQRKLMNNAFYDANLENISYEDGMQKKFKQRMIRAREIMKMKAAIKQINLEQKIYNTHIRFQSIEPKYVVVIQVHSNIILFRQLLTSLKSAYEISEALLIFSHDVFDPEINKAVQSVNFARYLQIFYPYSIQLHPNVFPGADRDKNGETKQSKLNRDPSAAQMKHHWWWQMNQVFDHLAITTKFNRPILFLEENNYVTIDFLVVLIILQHAKSEECVACEMLSLGAHKPNIELYKENATVTLEMWREDTPNIGIAFERSIWRSIKNYSQEFCHFNDFTWYNTLKHIGSQRTDTNFYLTAIDGPRVFYIEKCEKTDLTCKPEIKIRQVISFNERIQKMMFPTNIFVKLKIGNYFTVQGYGSFSDIRDHELCMYFSKNSVWF